MGKNINITSGYAVANNQLIQVFGKGHEWIYNGLYDENGHTLQCTVHPGETQAVPHNFITYRQEPTCGESGWK